LNPRDGTDAPPPVAFFGELFLSTPTFVGNPALLRERLTVDFGLLR